MPETKLVRIYTEDFDRLDTDRRIMQAITRQDMTIADAIRYLLTMFEEGQEITHGPGRHGKSCRA